MLSRIISIENTAERRNERGHIRFARSCSKVAIAPFTVAMFSRRRLRSSPLIPQLSTLRVPSKFAGPRVPQRCIAGWSRRAKRATLRTERQTLEAVILARNQASLAAQRAAATPGEATAMRDLAGAEAALGGALGRMFALAEAYPDLKSNTTMNQLSEELSSTENKVAFARQAYNDAVMAYNTGREIFPASIIAGATGFAEARLWEIERAVEREAVKVSFA